MFGELTVCPIKNGLKRARCGVIAYNIIVLFLFHIDFYSYFLCALDSATASLQGNPKNQQLHRSTSNLAGLKRNEQFYVQLTVHGYRGKYLSGKINLDVWVSVTARCKRPRKINRPRCLCQRHSKMQMSQKNQRSYLGQRQSKVQTSQNNQRRCLSQHHSKMQTSQNNQRRCLGQRHSKMQTSQKHQPSEKQRHLIIINSFFSISCNIPKAQENLGEQKGKPREEIHH